MSKFTEYLNEVASVKNGAISASAQIIKMIIYDLYVIRLPKILSQKDSIF